MQSVLRRLVPNCTHGRFYTSGIELLEKPNLRAGNKKASEPLTRNKGLRSSKEPTSRTKLIDKCSENSLVIARENKKSLLAKVDRVIKRNDALLYITVIMYNILVTTGLIRHIWTVFQMGICIYLIFSIIAKMKLETEKDLDDINISVVV
jgi:hypothetical protein